MNFLWRPSFVKSNMRLPEGLIRAMNSLHARLMFMLAILVTVTVVGLAYALIEGEQETRYRDLEGRAVRLTDLASRSVAYSVWNVDLGAIDEQLESLASDPEIVQVSVTAVGYGKLREIRKTAGSLTNPIVHVRDIRFETAETGLQKIGEVRVVLSRELVIKSIAEVHRAVWFLVAVILAVLYTTTSVLLRRMVSAPVHRLEVMVDTIAQGDLDARCVVESHDELGRLALRFNMMADRLHVSDSRLRESEERLRLALAAANQGLFDLDLTTGHARVSPEYAGMLGYDPDTFQETITFWLERMHPEDTARVQQVHEDYVAGRLPEYHNEFRQRTRDGRWKWILSQGRIMERAADGRPLRMLGTHTDIDAIKSAEAALQDLNATLESRVALRTAELSAANQELETFAYAVAHDLRAPLRAINGFTSILQSGYGAILPSEGRVYMEKIVRAGRKMSDLIDGLLVLSHSAQGELRMSRIDLSTLARKLLAELAATFPDRQVAVEVEDGLWVCGDYRMISSLLTNLLDNAWKYTGGTAEPKIYVRACEIDGRRGFCVADNGAGFDMANAERLFKAFHRLHRQDEFPGTGIGLATVQRIVRRHGGMISAEAAPGQGASFFVVMPEVECKSGQWAGA